MSAAERRSAVGSTSTGYVNEAAVAAFLNVIWFKASKMNNVVPNGETKNRSTGAGLAQAEE